jgi:Rtf2 RING-finger
MDALPLTDLRRIHLSLNSFILPYLINVDMGNDGGVVLSQRDLVIKTKGVDQKKNTPEQNKIKFTTCAISGEKLEPVEICTDELGHLFNKSALLTLLIEKRVPSSFVHIKSIKRDVYQLKPKFLHSGSNAESVIVCPLTMIEASGAHQFYAIKTCGCVFSSQAMNEIQKSSDDSSEVSTCPVCSNPTQNDSLIKLCPSEQELDTIRSNLQKKLDSSSKLTGKKRSLKESSEETIIR